MPLEAFAQFDFRRNGGIHVIAYADAVSDNPLYSNGFPGPARSRNGAPDALPVAKSASDTHHSPFHFPRKSQRYDFCQGLPYQGAFWQEKGR